MDRKERTEKLCLISFFFQRDYPQHVAQDVIKTVTLIFEFWQCLLLWSYPAAVAIPQHFQLHNENCPALSDCMYFLFLICLRSSQKSQALWLQSVWSIVQHQRGGLSAGSEWGVKVLRLRPVGAHYRWSPPPELITDIGRNMHLFILLKKREKQACFLSAGTEHEAANAETSPNSCFSLSSQPNVTI